MKNQRFNQPPRALRRPGVRCDNLVLVPGNLLAYKARWQAMANALPHGDVLVILPTHHGALNTTLSIVTRLIEEQGHHVTTLGPNDFL